MADNIKSCIVRVRDGKNSKVVGAGFLLDEKNKILVTCAHVIDAAIEGFKNQNKNNQTIKFDFPFIDSSLLLSATITDYIAKKEDGTGDIAILKVNSDLPAGVSSADTILEDSFTDHEIKVFGFPKSYEQDGRWAEGKLFDQLVNKQIQVVGATSLGYFVEKGFSGSPVFDKNSGSIVGMMAQVETDQNVRAAFLIPINLIAEVYPTLKYKDLREIKRDKIVYISYSRDDGEEVADRVYGDLKKIGINVWMDKYDIQDSVVEEGLDWNFEIDKALRASKSVVVILTPACVVSLQTTSEWNDAINRFVPVIPLLAKTCDVPRILSTLNYIDIRSDYNIGINKLKDQFKTLSEKQVEYLNRLLSCYVDAQKDAASPERFQHKINSIQIALDNIHTINSGINTTKRQQQIANGLKIEQKRVRKESKQRHLSVKKRVVGHRLIDISSYFRNREKQRKELGRLLSDTSTRLVSIIGRGGIGKTALVSKVLSELENSNLTEFGVKLDVDGILYLSTRTKGISLERIFLDCAEMLGGEKEKQILEVWTNLQLPTEDKIYKLFEILKEGFYIILLDNMEDLLDTEQKLRDIEMQMLLDISFKTLHNIRLLITTREKLSFPKEMMKFDKHILIEDGLPELDAVNVLRDLDPNGVFGLQTASDDLLLKITRKVHGVPRALEVVASILANDPFVTINNLLDNEQLFARGEFVEELVRENYKRLDNNSRKIMESLAIYGRPVPLIAIDFLLEPFYSFDIPIKSIVKRLINTYSVKYNNNTQEVSLHPIDRDYIYSQIPE